MHPRGDIVVELRVEQGVLVGQITLPDGIDGILITSREAMALTAGRNVVAARAG